MLHYLKVSRLLQKKITGLMSCSLDHGEKKDRSKSRRVKALTSYCMKCLFSKVVFLCTATLVTLKIRRLSNKKQHT